MKRYSFKRKPDNLHDQNEPNLVHDSHVDNNLMQFDQLHVEDGPNLVRYFEQLVRDEVSSCNLERLEPKCLERLEPKCLDSADSAHDWTGPETVQDCIDFDELLNDIHSTAASAQLLHRSLSGSRSLPFDLLCSCRTDTAKK